TGELPVRSRAAENCSAARRGGGAMTTAGGTFADGPGNAGKTVCWCCGQSWPESGVVRLGSHPEVAVCLRCAHFLHQQARGREDAARPSPATRVRDVLRAG